MGDETNYTDEDWDRMADDFIANAEKESKPDKDDENFDEEQFAAEDYDDYDDEPEEDINVYDKKKIYDSEIAPLVKQLKEICARECIPFFSTFAIANKPGKTKYKHEGVLTGSLGMELDDDVFERLLLVLCGGKVTPKGVNIEITEEDLRANSEILDSEDFDNDTDPEEDELSLLYDDVEEDMASLAAKAIETKVDFTNGNYKDKPSDDEPGNTINYVGDI